MAGLQLTRVDFTQAKHLKTIGKNAFQNNSRIPEIDIPDGVTSIGSGAFAGCNGMKRLSIPGSVRSIADGAFGNCTGLETVTMEEGLTHLAYRAFTGCESLKNIRLPSTLTSLGESAFCECKALKEITVPGSVKEIGDSTFTSCESLKTVTLEEGVERVSSHAFSGCKSMTSLKLPSTLTGIGYLAFSGCENLKTLTLPENLSEIGPSAFSNCKLIKEVKLPPKLTKIGALAFLGCSSLATVKIGDQVQEIGEKAFVETALSEIIIPESVETIGENAFDNCTGLKTINIKTKKRGSIPGEPWGAPDAKVEWQDTAISGDFIVDITTGEVVKYIGKNSDVIVPSTIKIDGVEHSLAKIAPGAFANNRSIRNVTIDEGIKVIGASAFEGSSLETVILPKTLTTIGNKAFYQCKKLKDINLPEALTAMGEFAFSKCNELRSVVIPGSVQKIEKGTFQDCSQLTKVTLSEGIEELGEYAFKNADKMKEITIPKSMKTMGWQSLGVYYGLKRIEIPDKTRDSIKGAPWGADHATVYWQDTPEVNDFIIDAKRGEIIRYVGTATEVTIPSHVVIDDKEVSITKIGPNAFPQSSKIRKVTIEDGIKEIGKAAFRNSNQLEAITIPETVDTIGESAFSGCTKLKEISIPKDVKTIENSVFAGCGSLTEIEIPDGVTEIKGNAFSGCTSLATFTIPESVQKIGGTAFSGCTSLKEITIPDGVTQVDYRLFSECSSLETVHLPDSIRAINWGAFEGCTSLREITIPQGVNWIGNSAFMGCSSLAELAIPDTVQSIDYQAFQDCTGLKELTLPKNLEKIKSGTFENCSSLEQLVIPEKVSSMAGNALQGTSSLKTIIVEQDRSGSHIKPGQPWGARKNIDVLYKGEYVDLIREITKVSRDYKRIIKYKATTHSEALIDTLKTPDGKMIQVGTPTRDGTYEVTENGTYIFIATNTNGVSMEHKIVIDDIGIPTVYAHNATISASGAPFMTKESIYKAIGASAKDETDYAVPFEISDEDLENVKALKDGQAVKITVVATHDKKEPYHQAETTVTVTASGDIPDTVTVTFMNEQKQHAQVQVERNQSIDNDSLQDQKMPANPKKDGFTFQSWNTQADGKGTAFTGESVVNGDMTVYAIFAAVPGTDPHGTDPHENETEENDPKERTVLIFKPNQGTWTGGSTEDRVYEVTVGEIFTIIDAPVREGYRFLYWQGSRFSPGDAFQVPEGGHTFTAVWEKADSAQPKLRETPRERLDHRPTVIPKAGAGQHQ